MRQRPGQPDRHTDDLAGRQRTPPAHERREVPARHEVEDDGAPAVGEVEHRVQQDHVLVVDPPQQRRLARRRARSAGGPADVHRDRADRAEVERPPHLAVLADADETVEHQPGHRRRRPGIDHRSSTSPAPRRDPCGVHYGLDPGSRRARRPQPRIPFAHGRGGRGRRRRRGPRRARVRAPAGGLRGRRHRARGRRRRGRTRPHRRRRRLPLRPRLPAAQPRLPGGPPGAGPGRAALATPPRGGGGGDRWRPPPAHRPPAHTPAPAAALGRRGARDAALAPRGRRVRGLGAPRRDRSPRRPARRPRRAVGRGPRRPRRHRRTAAPGARALPRRRDR